MSDGASWPPALQISLTVNAQPVAATVEDRLLLSDFLREALGLTGTVVGCEHGVCGSCTIQLNGAAVRSCLMLAVQADGAEVKTIEGITPPGGLSRLQQSFADHHGLQCGFCTAGILMTLSSVAPADYLDDEAIRRLLSGTICRCTGYEKIVESVRAAWNRDSND
jgi:aerobic-type carbon monoxide dehydrogenase small subunit (CoxS/CutS family)